MGFLALSVWEKSMWSSSLAWPVIIVIYPYLFWMVFDAVFSNIVEIDKFEFENHLPRIFLVFEKEMPFFCTHMEDKRVYSKKTVIAQLWGYIIAAFIAVFFLISLVAKLRLTAVLAAASAFAAFVYHVVVDATVGKNMGRCLKNREKSKSLTKKVIALTEDEKVFVSEFRQKTHPSIYEDDHSAGALFLETLDLEVCPYLLRGERIDAFARMEMMESYRRFLENADPDAFDEYAKAYFEDVQSVMRIFEKYYGTPTP